MAGLLKVDDLGSAWDPSWDLRIAEGHRGAGLGTAAVRWLAGEVFGGWPGVRRIEAQTRRDNLAMRAVLRRCGYVKEAGTTTPVDWDEG